MTARDKTSVILTTVLLVVILTMVISAFAFGPKAQQFPLIVGVPTSILLVFLLIAERLPASRSIKLLEVGLEGLLEKEIPTGKASGVEAESEQAGDLRAVWTIVFGLTLFVVLILLVGFFVAVPICVFAFLILQGKLDWLKATAFAAVLWVVLYIFQRVLGLELWLGVIPEVIPGILGGGILPPL